MVNYVPTSPVASPFVCLPDAGPPLEGLRAPIRWWQPIGDRHAPNATLKGEKGGIDKNLGKQEEEKSKDNKRDRGGNSRRMGVRGGMCKTSVT